MVKRLIAILLACALAVQPVYVDNGEKLGKKQKSKEQAEIEKAEIKVGRFRGRLAEKPYQ